MRLNLESVAGEKDIDTSALYKLPRKVKFVVYVLVVYSTHILATNLHKKNGFHANKPKFLYLYGFVRRNLSLAVKNIQVSLMLFRSLIRIFTAKYI